MLSPELQKRARELTQAANTPLTEDPPPHSPPDLHLFLQLQYPAPLQPARYKTLLISAQDCLHSHATNRRILKSKVYLF